ncbi:MAG: AAA family ATPase [Cyclobacteriaceae bacterium]
MRSKLIDISIKNLGCIGNDKLIISLDNILCLVGNNNSGKSTVLRAYELAVGTEKYDSLRDRSKHSNYDTEIEISVHIPEKVGNIAEKWKEVKGDLRIVRSRWAWDRFGTKTRETYDPEKGEYSVDGNAAGLDNVFTSRLPKPFRIGALDNPEQELDKLLKIIVDPIGEKLKASFEEEDSDLRKSLDAFNKEALKPIEAEAKKIEAHSEDISKNHRSIFPDLKIDLKIGISEIKFDPIRALVDGSRLDISEYDHIVNWNQQGTGSQRALFWSILQVRSKLQSKNDLQKEYEKEIKTLESEIKKLEKARDKAAKADTKASKQSEIDVKQKRIEELQAKDVEQAIAGEENEVSLPGYMLLIDEPETALHPNAIRAASKYLYDLAKDKSWQVMLTTHSPLFLNPFVDNTTIVRLTRADSIPSPLTYRSDSIVFSDEEKKQLVLLNTFDQNLAEMFFGQHPIVVEGDTEFAAFQKVMDMNIDKYPLSSRPLVIRARGKFTIIPILKMLNHFKVDFSVLHDSDYPKNKRKAINNVWTGNERILEEINICRRSGRKVIHRISISTFEIEHRGVDMDDDNNVILPTSTGKPFEMYDLLGKDSDVKDSVEKVFDELINLDSREEAFESGTTLKEAFNEWVKENKINDSRFSVS